MKEPIRKIIHIDMDAFFASVEQRDNPELKGKPVAVGHADKRCVVATASYEARQFGVHSAMAMVTARRLCPQLIVVPPHFEAYRAVSKQIHEIFAQYTDLIEPVSLDEAYLDVTKNKKHIPSAWTVARNIRDDILRVTGLTASAGVSFNKFLAKAASDMNKPDGQFLITPEQSTAFLADLPIGRFHGIGPKTTEKMQALGIESGHELKQWSREALEMTFGKLGGWYYQVVRGDDDRPVEPHRDRKSASAEATFPDDLFERERIETEMTPLIAHVWAWAQKSKQFGRTVTIKIKWADFTQSTKSRSAPHFITDEDEFRQITQELVASLFPIEKGIRLLGVGISNFKLSEPKESRQLPLDITLP